MNKCTRALTHTCVNEFSCQSQAPAYFFSSPGPSRAVCCASMSKSDFVFRHCKGIDKKNAFQSLETHSETKFRKSVENQKLSQKPHQNQLTGRRSVLPPFIHMKTHIGMIADRALNGPQRTSELECHRQRQVQGSPFKLSHTALVASAVAHHCNTTLRLTNR